MAPDRISKDNTFNSIEITSLMAKFIKKRAKPVQIFKLSPKEGVRLKKMMEL